MRGLLLTGPTGVGKSTAQIALREQHGFWVPRTCTTRPIEPTERDVVHVPEQEFLRGARDGRIVLPASFGAEWYGWFREDLDTLRDAPGRAVLNVRPYPALLLGALLTDFLAVWLTIDDHELAHRRATRFATRDTNESLRQRRHSQDEDDAVYRSCFERVLPADEDLVANLLALLP